VVGDTCWSCRARVRAIVGVLVDPGLTEDRSGFLALADVDRILMAVVDLGELAELAVDVTVDLLGHRVWRGAARMR
jgi:hypothetical protein